METSSKKFGKGNLGKASRNCIMFCIFIMSAAQRAFAQADLKNLKHSLSSIKDEQEKIAHQEFMSYVYMVLGFAVVIAIAWITTVKARKRSAIENEAKMKFIQQNLAKKHAAHGHSTTHAGHTLHKARR